MEYAGCDSLLCLAYTLSICKTIIEYAGQLFAIPPPVPLYRIQQAPPYPVLREAKWAPSAIKAAHSFPQGYACILNDIISPAAKSCGAGGGRCSGNHPRLQLYVDRYPVTFRQSAHHYLYQPNTFHCLRGVRRGEKWRAWIRKIFQKIFRKPPKPLDICAGCGIINPEYSILYTVCCI